eukprot:6764310-Pyramimonas_sp.AAC.1
MGDSNTPPYSFKIVRHRPRGRQDGIKTQEAPTSTQESPKMAPREPERPSDSLKRPPKMAAGRPRRLPRLRGEGFREAPVGPSKPQSLEIARPALE